MPHDLFLLETSQYKTSKEGSTVGVTVSHASLLAQCRALTQACGYSEGKGTRGSMEALPPRAVLSTHLA